MRITNRVSNDESLHLGHHWKASHPSTTLHFGDPRLPLSPLCHLTRQSVGRRRCIGIALFYIWRFFFVFRFVPCENTFSSQYFITSCCLLPPFLAMTCSPRKSSVIFLRAFMPNFSPTHSNSSFLALKLLTDHGWNHWRCRKRLVSVLGWNDWSFLVDKTLRNLQAFSWIAINWMRRLWRWT